MATAGRVAMIPKGDYDSATTYQNLDVVRYENDIYVAKKASTGVLPTNTDYWMLCMENVTQEQYDAILNGTTPVGDSKLLEGLTAEEVGTSGARNLLPYPYGSTTFTTNGITATDNGDGTVSLSGTASALTNFSFIHRNEKKMPFKVGDTITISGGYTADVRLTLNVYDVNGSIIQSLSDIGNGDTATISDSASYIEFYIRITIGAVANVTIKPMLELGSVAHDWVPYHFGGAEHALDADTVGGIKLYKSFSEIGSNISKNTPIKDVVSAMAVNSRLVVTVYNPADGIYPITNGVLEINKTYSSEHTSLKFTAHTGKGFWHGLAQTNGNYWTGWIKNANADEVLPLTGGTLSGDLVIAKSGYSTQTKIINYNGSTFLRNYTDDDNYKDLLIRETGLSYINRENGKGSTYDILHTGNSNAVIKATTAPSNTTAVWVDTANKKVKAYIDGAWTVIA